MSSLIEKLQRIYQPKDTQESSSWIPKRKYRKGDLISEIRSGAPQADGVSSQRAEEMLGMEAVLYQTKEDIFEQVAIYLLERYGEKDLDVRLANFVESWESLYDKYGSDLIYALGPLVDSLYDEPFVQHMGHLKKVAVREEVRKLKARRRDQ